MPFATVSSGSGEAAYRFFPRGKRSWLAAGRKGLTLRQVLEPCRTGKVFNQNLIDPA